MPTPPRVDVRRGPPCGPKPFGLLVLIPVFLGLAACGREQGSGHEPAAVPPSAVVGTWLRQDDPADPEASAPDAPAGSAAEAATYVGRLILAEDHAATIEVARFQPDAADGILETNRQIAGRWTDPDAQGAFVLELRLGTGPARRVGAVLDGDILSLTQTRRTDRYQRATEAEYQAALDKGREAAGRLPKAGPPLGSPLVAASKKQLEELLRLLLADVERSGGTWPPCSGKNFVLSLVASGAIPRDDPAGLRLLFSPGDEVHSLAKVDPARYVEVTTTALERGLAFEELTSYAGRRNADPEYRIRPSTDLANTPVLADTSFPGIVLLGFGDGTVKASTFEELGMVPPEDPYHPDPFLGDDALVPLLLGLSDE